MTVTKLEDEIEAIIMNLDELTWIPQETITEIRNKLEDVSDLLCEAESEYGDENPSECDGDMDPGFDDE